MKSVQIDMLIRQDKKYISMECMNDILSIRLDIISHILWAVSQICRCSHIFNIDIIEYYYILCCFDYFIMHFKMYLSHL